MHFFLDIAFGVGLIRFILHVDTYVFLGPFPSVDSELFARTGFNPFVLKSSNELCRRWPLVNLSIAPLSMRKKN